MRALLAASLALMITTPVLAQEFTPAQRTAIIGIMRDALRHDPTILRDAIAGLQADEARQQQQTNEDAIGRLGSRLVDPADPVAGNPLGKVTIVEFYDTRCPYCRTMEPVMANLLHADSGVKLVVKDLPILGPNSLLESRALLAAQRQGGYFKLRPAIMALSGTTTSATLHALAQQQGLDGDRLLRDMEDPAIKTRLDTNLGLAHQLGIEGTPAFIVGGHMISGAASLSEMQAAVAAVHGG